MKTSKLFLTRAASSTCGRAISKFLSVNPLTRHLSSLAAAAGFILLAVATTATAQTTYTWTGAAADGDWNNAANWDANGVPVDSDPATAVLTFPLNAAGNGKIVFNTNSVPTLNIPVLGGTTAATAGSPATPYIELLQGTMNLSLNSSDFSWRSTSNYTVLTVGDGNMANGTATLNLSGIGNANPRYNNGTNNYLINADGILNITPASGFPLVIGRSATIACTITINGGTVVVSQPLQKLTHANYLTSYIEFTAFGGSFTAIYATSAQANIGGSTSSPTSWEPLDLAAVQAAIASKDFRSAAGLPDPVAVDNGDGTFTVSLPAPAVPIQLTITPNGGNYDFSWASLAGKQYDLLNSIDLATPVATWPVYDDGVTTYANIPYSGTGTNTLTGVLKSGPTRFFALREKPL